MGSELLTLARERGQKAYPAQAEKIRLVSHELSAWIDDPTESLDQRVPQIRDLNRALLNVLLVSRLVDEAEAASLQQGLR
jgi:hypothetical protein